MNELTITESNFQQEVLESQVPVMVEFGATWCTPCKVLAPVIHEIAAETSNAKVALVDVDEQSGLAQQFNIMSVPTILFFKDGKVMDQMVGVQSKEALTSKLAELT